MPRADDPVKALPFDLPANASEAEQELKRIRSMPGVAFVFQDYLVRALGKRGEADHQPAGPLLSALHIQPPAPGDDRQS